MTNARLFLAAVAAGCALGANATAYTWKSSAEDPAGVFTNTVHFYNGTTPVDPADITPADQVDVGSTDEPTGHTIDVSMPAGVEYVGSICPRFHAYDNGRKLVYDGPGIWRQADLAPDAAVKYTHDQRFNLVSWSTVFLQCADSSAGGRTNGTFRLDNAKFRISRGVSGSPLFDLDRGTLNLYDPNGKARGDTYIYTAACTYPKVSLAFHEGSCFKAPVMLFYRTAATNEFVVDGGSEHYVHRMRLRYDNDRTSDTRADRMRLVVTGDGTKLTLGEFSRQDDNTDYRHKVTVTSNATLAVSGGISQMSGGRGVDWFALSDGGALELGRGKYAFVWNYANLAVTNASLTSTAITGGEALKFNGAAHISVKDSTWKSSSLALNGVGSQMHVDGGSFQATSLFLADASGASAKFTFDGGTHSLTNLYVGGTGRGEFALSNGTVAISSGLFAGQGSGNSGSVYLAGGKISADQMVLGASGSGEMVVSDGASASCRLFGFVWNDVAGTENTLRMVGGSLTAREGLAMVASSSSQNCKAHAILEGGVLTGGGVRGSAGCSAANPAKTGIATLYGNGGTLRANSAHERFVASLNSATCGEKGLTIESDYNITIPQGFDNASGATGQLILTGIGTKTLSGTNNVSRIVVAGGTLVFADGAKAYGELVVTNGAKVAFAGAPGDVGLTGLVLGDATTAGVVQLSPGQTVAVAGDVTVNNARLALSGDFALDTTSTLLTASGNVSAASRATWADALIASGAAEGRSYSLESSDEGGTVSFKMAVAASALEIVQESGTRDYAEAVSFGPNARLLVAVSNGATLTVSGKVSKGALDKVGGGKFYLTNDDNVLMSGITSAAGLFSVPSVSALGCDALGLNTFALRGGTLEFTSSSSETYPGTITVNAGSGKAAVLKNEGDLTVNSISVTSGDIVKRGAGRLVVEPPSGSTLTLSVDSGTCSNNWDPSPLAADLDDDGAAPTGGYMGFNVAEGELVLKGDATTTFNARKGVMIGLRTSKVSVQPTLTVDGAKAYLATSDMFQLCGYQTSSSKAYRPRFTVKNGAYVTIGTFVAGRSEDAYCYPTTTVDNATLSVTAGSGFRAGYNDKCRHGIVLRNNAKLYASSMLHYGPTYFDVSNSVVQKNAAGDCTELSLNSMAGTWNFRAGSYLALKKITTDRTRPADGLTINFDGGTWETGGGSYTTFYLCNASTYDFRALGTGGLTLPVAAGKTVRVARAISGDGPIVKTGAGALVFETQGTWDSAITTKTPLADPVSLATTGTLDVREGMVVVSNGACRAGGAYRAASGTSVDFDGNSLGAASFAGAGAFSNFSASGATIVSDAEGEAVPTFSGATIGGVTHVDFGRSPGDPLQWEGVVDLPVARFTGGAPNVSRWKVTGVGVGNVGGKFSVTEDGEVRVTLERRGLTIVVL